MRYVLAFIVAAPTMGLLAHYVTNEPMPWWPDTFVFAGFMGALAAFVVMRLTYARRSARHLRRIGRAVTGKRP